MLGDRDQRVVVDVQLDVLKLEQALVLLDERVLWFDENLDQRLDFQLGDRTHHRQTANELGDQTKLDEVLWSDVGEQRTHIFLRRRANVGAETHPNATLTSLDHLLEEAGVVGPSTGSKAREVLIEAEGLEDLSEQGF